jgi:hypothetical protein
VATRLSTDSWSLVGPFEQSVAWLGKTSLKLAKVGGPAAWGGGAGLDVLAHAGCATVARQGTGQMTPTPVSGGSTP